jgi:hypothetical protein
MDHSLSFNEHQVKNLKQNTDRYKTKIKLVWQLLIRNSALSIKALQKSGGGGYGIKGKAV